MKTFCIWCRHFSWNSSW